MKTSTLVRRFAPSVALMLGFVAPALGNSSYSGTVSGLWSAPVLSGTVIDAATGAPSSYDNTATANCNLAACPVALAGDPATLLVWGSGAAALPYSSVQFVGASFSNVLPGQVFELGRLSYLNGTSGLTTLIFAATLTLQARSGAVALTDPLAVGVNIVTTANSGTPEQNADYLDFGTGTFGTVQPVSFNVYEGETATAILYGSIVGDPQLKPVTIVMAAGSTGGFIGNGLPAPVPEPGSPVLLLLGLGMGGLAAWRRRTG